MVGIAVAADIVGRIDDIEPNGQRLRVILQPYAISPPIKTQKLRLSLPQKNNDNLKPGDTISLIAKIYTPYPPLVPSGFDWQEWLYQRGISHIGFSMGRVTVLHDDISQLPPLKRLHLTIERLRYNTTQSWIKSSEETESNAFAAALFTGMQGGMSTEINNAMRTAGLTHLISISGLHMSLVAGLFYLTMRYMLALFVYRFPVKQVAAGGAWIFSLLYLGFSGAEVPTLRSFIMISMGLLAIITDRQPFSLWTVFIAALIIITYDWHAIFSPGFQLSFMAVTALIVYYQRHRHDFDDTKGRLQRLWLYFYGLFISTFWVNIVTMPIVAWHFYRFSVYGPLANMLAIPLSSIFLMPLIVLSALATPFHGQEPILWVFSIGANALFDFCYWIQDLPYSNILLGSYQKSAFICFLMASIIFLFANHWWRLLMIPLILVGALIIHNNKYPDILISHDGNHLALLNNNLTIYTRKENNFTFSKWADYYGYTADQIRTIIINDRENVPDICQNRLCLIHLKNNYTIAMPLSQSALQSVCIRTDINLLITPFTAPLICNAKKVVDRLSLKQTGSQVIWLSPYRNITDYDIRGKKPWNNY